MVQASAPGKVILLGEHAVVYGQPALAVPVTQVQATATVESHSASLGIWIEARNLRRRYRLEEARASDSLAAAIRLTFAHLTLPIDDYALHIAIDSTIPIASGLGSGAAVCTAVVRALGAYLQSPIPDAGVSSIVFETEKLLHGTPSGIDNTVIAYARPVYFIKGQPPVPFAAAHPFHLLIADTGLPSPTRITVGEVRAGYEREPEKYARLFAAIGALVRQARTIIEGETPPAGADLGELMTRNHALLQEMGVSCKELDTLVEAAHRAGALGAKLSGGGRGGNLIALVKPGTAPDVEAALREAGARRVIHTVLNPQSPISNY